jgi:CRP-like cAMP-binding protein
MNTTLDLFKNEVDIKQFSAGETIFDEGQPGGVMYAVVEGDVDIILHGELLDTVTHGGIFGEMGIIEPAARSAKAVARTNCALVAVDENRFKMLVHTTPFFALQVLRITVERLRRTTQRI